MIKYANESTGWPICMLGDAIERIETGVSPKTLDRPISNGEIGVLKVSAVTWGTFRPQENKALPLDFNASGIPTVGKGDLLLSRANTAELLASPVVTDRDYPNLILSDKTLRLVPMRGVADSRFLFYCLRQPEARRFFFSNATGTSGSMRNVSQATIRRCPIPLPPLLEQKRIADILDKADAIRRKRRDVIEIIAGSYKSLFLSMFGDPVENHRQLPVKTIAELTTRISKGESPKWQGYDYQDDGVQFITSENVRWGYLDTTTPKFVPHAFHTKLARSQLAKNDLLINLVGASVGRSALVPESELPANVNQAVAVVSLDQKQMLPTFLLHQLLNDRMQRVLLGNAVESARANISLTNIRDTRVIVPDIDEQRTWDSTVFRITKLSASSLCAWQECDTLFNSLVQHAFKGEL